MIVLTTSLYPERDPYVPSNEISSSTLRATTREFNIVNVDFHASIVYCSPNIDVPLGSLWI